MAEDPKAPPAVLGEVQVVTAPVEGSHGGRHMVSTSGTQAEVDSALTYSVQAEGTPTPDTAPTAPAVAPAPDAAPVTPDVVAPDPKPEDPRSVQGRISHYTQLAREADHRAVLADHRAVLAEQRAAALELRLTTQQPPETPAAPAVEPIPAEFTSTEQLGEYIARTVRTGVETGLAERDTRTRAAQAETAAAQAETAAAEVERTWDAQVTSAAATREDWSAVFTQAGTTERGTDAVLEVAKTFVNGAEVLYDLAKSPQALTQMGQMTQRDREIAFAVVADRVQRAAEAGQAAPVIPTPPNVAPTPPQPITPMPPVAPSAPTSTPPVLNEHSSRGDYKAWKVANGIKF